MIVLDTDIVTLLSYGNEKIEKRIEGLADDEDLAVSIITRMEILGGRFDTILKAASAAELRIATQRFQAAEEMLNDFIVLHPDEAACRHFETLLRPKKGKKKMRRGDLLIASIALAHDALLVTRNTRDFQGVSGLRVENWAD
jgi:predicted nucleic acid-binding protein